MRQGARTGEDLADGFVAEVGVVRLLLGSEERQGQAPQARITRRTLHERGETSGQRSRDLATNLPRKCRLFAGLFRKRNPERRSYARTPITQCATSHRLHRGGGLIDVLALAFDCLPPTEKTGVMRGEGFPDVPLLGRRTAGRGRESRGSAPPRRGAPPRGHTEASLRRGPATGAGRGPRRGSGAPGTGQGRGSFRWQRSGRGAGGGPSRGAHESGRGRGGGV